MPGIKSKIPTMAQKAPPTDKAIIKNQLEILSIAEGFFQSGILFTLLKLKIFDHIGEGSQTPNELAMILDARPDTLARLLNAGVMLKLLESDDGARYRLTSACRAVLLPSAGENYLGNWIRLQSDFYSAYANLDEAVLKSKPPVQPAVYLGADQDKTRQYILAMHNYASVRGSELAHYLDTSTCKTLLDLGCGAGTYAVHLAMHNPSLELYLSDLPEVLEIAREIQGKNPLPNKINYLPLDAEKSEIPGSYDLILASNMLHCIRANHRIKVIKRLYRALNPGGSLVVQAQYLHENRMGGRWAVLVDLNLLCTTEGGKNHTVGETKAWLEEAGFKDLEYSPMSVYGANSFVRGYKSA